MLANLRRFSLPVQNCGGGGLVAGLRPRRVSSRDGRRGLEAAWPAVLESAASVAAGRRARPALLQIGVRHWQSRRSHQAATTVVNVAKLQT